MTDATLYQDVHILNKLNTSELTPNSGVTFGSWF